MTRPTTLKKGDHIALVSPSGIVDKDRIQDGLRLLESWGLLVEEGRYVYGQKGMYAGSDEERIEDLQKALDNTEVKAIICARGGYGLLRIIDRLDFSAFQKNPKWIVGFSDITILHAHLNKVLKIESIHAPMPGGLAKDEESDQSLRALLFGEKVEYEIPWSEYNRAGKASGELIGGNLSILYALQGSKDELEAKKKILFIEDLGEYFYHLDRMMLNLKRSGKLEKLAGLLVGGMTDLKEGSAPFGKNSAEIILEAVKDYDYPVAFNFPAGHQLKNLALVLGRKARLEIDASQCKLTY